MNILFDLSNAQHGHSGIQNEMRNMLNVFFLNKYTLSGFLYDNRHKAMYSSVNFDTSSETDKLISASRALSVLTDSAEDTTQRFFISRMYKKIVNLYIHFVKTKFDSIELNNQMKEVLYRQFIMQDYDTGAFQAFMNSPLFLSNFSEHINVHRQLISANYPLANINLDTSKYDFVVTQTEIPSFKFSPKTLKVIRFYDLIPITNPDNVSNSYYRSLLQHRNILENIKQNSIFVSISRTVANELEGMYPQLKNRSFSIPCTVPQKFMRVMNSNKFSDILNTYSSTVVARGPVSSPLNLSKKEIEASSFILFLSTIEPRKNLLTLIKAFNEIKNNKYDSKTPRLLIVGKLGWMYDSIVKIMLPLIKSGRLIYLSNPPFEELNYIYSHANVFVMPSFAEGFGLIQIEAMSCGCPVISSNIPVHEEIQGDASLYANPYDFKGFASKIDFVLDPKNQNNVKQMVEKGYLQAKKYTEDNTSKQWESLFSELLERKNKTGKYY